MLTEIDTSLILPAKRLEFWRKNTAAILGFGHPIEGSKDLFNARLKAYSVGRLRVVEIIGTPHKSTASADAETEHFAVVLSLDGRMIIQQDEREACLEKDELGLYSLDRPHTVESVTPFHQLNINVPIADLKEILPGYNRLTAIPVSLKNGTGQLLLATVKALCECAGEIEPQKTAADAAAAAILSLLQGVLIEIPQIQEASLSRLEFYHKERIRSFIKANLRTNLSVDSISKAVNLSPRYVHSLFSTEPLSLMKWVWMERLERCRRDLELPTLNGRSVSEVAFSWGFNDPAHFSRTFRSRFGASPTEHREHALEMLRQSQSIATPGDIERVPLR